MARVRIPPPPATAESEITPIPLELLTQPCIALLAITTISGNLDNCMMDKHIMNDQMNWLAVQCAVYMCYKGPFLPYAIASLPFAICVGQA